MRVAVVAQLRFPIAEPYAGGLEAHTASLAQGLLQRGHEVLLFASPGSDPVPGLQVLPVEHPVLSAAARADVSMTAEGWMQEHHAYLQLMLDLAAGVHDVDVVHNNSLHHLPIAMSATLPVPVVTTLHTPPTPWLESAIQTRPHGSLSFAAVSSHTARAWRHAVPAATVVPNGVDVARFHPGPGGGPAVWSGRLVPEKGADLAAEAACRAGVPLRLAGPVLDREWFESRVRPWLGREVEHVGHLGVDELARLLGESSVFLATPCWEEPYGLVVAESLSCGTPVAGFSRGALPELVDGRSGRLVAGGDVGALADVLPDAMGLSRADARSRAEQHCSLDAMVRGYERVYADALEAAWAA